MSDFAKEEYETLSSFRYALRRFQRFSEQAARAAGLTPQQHQLLLAIKGMPGRDWATVSEVAEQLQTTHHAAVGLTLRAEAAGLVLRTPDAGDRRQICVRLTERGQELLAELTAVHRRELERLGSQLQFPRLGSPPPERYP